MDEEVRTNRPAFLPSHVPLGVEIQVSCKQVDGTKGVPSNDGTMKIHESIESIADVHKEKKPSGVQGLLYFRRCPPVVLYEMRASTDP